MPKCKNIWNQSRKSLYRRNDNSITTLTKNVNEDTQQIRTINPDDIHIENIFFDPEHAVQNIEGPIVEVSDDENILSELEEESHDIEIPAFLKVWYFKNNITPIALSELLVCLKTNARLQLPIAKNLKTMKQIQDSQEANTSSIAEIKSTVETISEMLQSFIGQKFTSTVSIKNDDLFKITTFPISTIKRLNTFNEFLLSTHYLEQTVHYTNYI